MKYQDAPAFRMALEQRLKDGAGDGAALTRHRKRVAFDRLLVRLQAVATDRWVLKGGFALDLRLAARARSTKDVDIKLGRQYSWSQTDGLRRERDFAGQVGFAIPRRGGGLVAGVDRRLELIDPDGTTLTVATVEEGRTGNRFNDAKCDPVGRLWAGTMSIDREAGAAALYRLEAGGELKAVVTGLTISNGLGWSPDGERMYLIDSTTQAVDVFDYDLGAGLPSRRRRFAAIDPEDGLPDGLAVDSDGGVWVALFGGGEVRRFAPGGQIDARVELPTTNCTCPAFGGADLRDLFVTTARHRLGPEQLLSQPLAGALFRTPCSRAGQALTPFAG